MWPSFAGPATSNCFLQHVLMETETPLAGDMLSATGVSCFSDKSRRQCRKETTMSAGTADTSAVCFWESVCKIFTSRASQLGSSRWPSLHHIEGNSKGCE